MFNPFDVSKRNFQLSVENNRFALVLSFALLCSVIGPEKKAPLHQPIEFKTNTNYDLVACVFPRSMGGLRNFNVDFHWLVTVSYFLPSGCCFWFWFWFYDNHQSKSALFTTESTGRLHYVFLVIIIVDIKRTKSIRVMNKL